MSRYCYCLLYVVLPFVARAQLVVSSSTYTPQQLVQNVLLGSGIYASNITYNGDPLSIGYFDGTNSNIGLKSGLILSSGDINLAPGPNNSSSVSYMWFGPGDTDLDLLAFGPVTEDAAVLEFDFIPLMDTVRFKYVFGSEEYLEFVNQNYDDIFAFFLSGPGIVGQKNIAVLPGTTTPVSIDNVNDVVNSAYYRDNGDGVTTGGLTVQYDGFTTVLEAISVVQPCQTYHIKMAIADVGDGGVDSGVFLEAGSFGQKKQYVSADSSAAEGCQSAGFTISTDGPMSQDTVIHFVIGGSATNGVDYNWIADSVLIKAGDSAAKISLVPIVDGISENDEDISITVNQFFSCTGTYIPLTASTLLKNVDPLSVTTGISSTICAGGSTYIDAYVVGGYGTYQFNWSNGAGTDSSVIVKPSATTIYTVTVSDNCAHTATGTETVTVVQSPVVNFGNDTTLCVGDSLVLDAGYPGASYYWSNYKYTQKVTVKSTGKYWVRLTLGSCITTDTIKVTFNPVPNVNIGPDTVLCVGDSVQFNAGNTGYNYLWNNGSTNQKITAYTTGAYVVRVYAGSCSDADTALVLVNPFPLVNLGSDTALCKGQTLLLDAGNPGATYAWNNGSVAQSQSVDTTGLYQVVVAFGKCRSADSIHVSFNQLDMGTDRDLCDEPGVLLDAQVENASYLWSTGETTKTIQVSTSGTYWVEVISGSCLLTDTIAVEIALPALYFPSAFTPNGDAKNEYFLPYGNDIEEYSLFIFNRWGEEVFSTTDLEKGWDGKIRGAAAPVGVYVWKALYKSRCSDSKKINRVGYFTLMR